jgi:hypothetical protein
MNNATVNDPMIIAIKKLKTQRWGRFFFTVPVVSAINSIKACDILQSTEARVLIPDSEISRSTPLYGAEGWEKYGMIGSLDYPGKLIPLSVVKVHNPDFDYMDVLSHGVRRPEYESGVIGHFDHIKSVQAVC